MNGGLEEACKLIHTSAQAVLSQPASISDSKRVDGVTTSYEYDNADQLTREQRSGYDCSCRRPSSIRRRSQSESRS